MLLGHWKNIEELEDSLCLEELELIVKTMRDKERREQVFLASLRGIDLNGDNESAKEKFERAKKRAQAKIENKSAKEMERDEFAAFGIQMKE